MHMTRILVAILMSPEGVSKNLVNPTNKFENFGESQQKMMNLGLIEMRCKYLCKGLSMPNRNMNKEPFLKNNKDCI